ncbi:protein kinase family protein [Plantactinospora sp. S1510]|uniref:non-specific serine/threonine protein kinase n=1 Tax=Plantactinospora alkalitolerans TaxID=2789879 RepID=A0ABS0GVD9_9ACTN|nr:protein kinase family protein [Plantactinospora alkalitolerans]MBF9130034.1 protein kinase family protein [Plantactinospora alkalitolerans]MBF9130090.1 protein kinase family protein [Plantactinospora alkalitolerans]
MPSSTGPSIDTITEGGRVTQVGEGQEADEVAPSVMTFGAPAVGEILAERYELADHINDDSAGRQVWRGVDVILRRPVAVVLRYPGGDSAKEMLQAAVAASRVIHPNLVGVYDAIDEEDRAYVVREWVDGHSLRELVADGVLDPTRATSIAHAIAGAIAAIHATGMVHGNLHPGTVMVGDDGRVVLADARTDGADTPETDVRAVGGVLYYALTGHWPHAEASLTSGSGRRARTALPDAVRDASGTIAAPRQVRAGVPAYLDDLTMDLLDSQLPVPSSDVLAAELSRLDAAAGEQYLDSGPLRFTSGDDAGPDLPATGGRRMLIGVAALLVVALVGLLLGINALVGGDPADDQTGSSPTPGTTTQPAAAGDPDPPTTKPQKVAIKADQVRIIDPDGTPSELDGAEKVVDGDPNEAWETESYKRSSKFGNNKAGMGVLIDLGEPRAVTSVQVQLSDRGAAAELRSGTQDFAKTSAGDKQLVAAYKLVGNPIEADGSGSTMTFSSFEPDQTYRYLLLWITELPEVDPGQFRVGVQEITVQSR